MLVPAVALALTLASADPSPAPPAPAESASAEAAPAVVEVAPAVSAVDAPIRVAVYDIDVKGADARVKTVVTNAVVQELRKMQGASVMSMTEMKAMLGFEAEKQILGCADDSCLAEIASALGADHVVIGSVTRLSDDEEVFDLRVIDQRNAKTLGQVNQRLEPHDGSELLAVLGAAVEALYPTRPLRAGAGRGVSDVMALRLNPPPLDPWVFAVAAGSTGALALGAGVITVITVQQQQQFLAFQATKSYPNDVYDAAAAQVAALEYTMIGAWVVVGAAAVATAGIAGFTDFWGYKRDVVVEAQ